MCCWKLSVSMTLFWPWKAERKAHPHRMLQSGGAKASVILLKDNACQGKGNWEIELGRRLQQRASGLAALMAKSTSLSWLKMPFNHEFSTVLEMLLIFEPWSPDVY